MAKFVSSHHTGQAYDLYSSHQSPYVDHETPVASEPPVSRAAVQPASERASEPKSASQRTSQPATSERASRSASERANQPMKRALQTLLLRFGSREGPTMHKRGQSLQLHPQPPQPPQPPASHLLHPAPPVNKPKVGLPRQQLCPSACRHRCEQFTHENLRAVCGAQC